jgi:UDP-glucose 4-epimerase
VATTALTGCRSFLGARLLRRLADTRRADHLLALDLAPPSLSLGARYRRLDLTDPAAEPQLAEILRDEGVETLIHTAFLTNPSRDSSYAHELEAIGSLSVMAAAAAAGVRHVVMRSFTAVYGARGDNPCLLTEDRPLPQGSGLAWAREKLEAEQHAASFARRYPALTVTVLRFAPLLGPGVRTFYTRILDNRLVPVLLGYDPLIQFLHPDDALAAVEAALEKRTGGVFNVVPSRSIPLGSALHLAAKVPVPVAHPVAYAFADMLWHAGVSRAPGAFLDFVRYPVVADGRRARRELGIAPLHSSRDALMSYLRYRHTEHAAPRLAEA